MALVADIAYFLFYHFSSKWQLEHFWFEAQLLAQDAAQ